MSLPSSCCRLPHMCHLKTAVINSDLQNGPDEWIWESTQLWVTLKKKTTKIRYGPLVVAAARQTNLPPYRWHQSFRCLFLQSKEKRAEFTAINSKETNVLTDLCRYPISRQKRRLHIDRRAIMYVITCTHTVSRFHGHLPLFCYVLFSSLTRSFLAA